MMMRRAAAPVAQKSFRIKQMDKLFQQGDTMVDYIPKICNNCKNCSTCVFAGRSISQKERIELEYIDCEITHNEKNNVFNIKYPFLDPP